MTDGVTRTTDSLLGSDTNKMSCCKCIRVLSVGTRRLDHSLLWTTKEAAKAAKLVVYSTDITLA